MSKEPKKRIQIHYETDTQIEELMNEFIMEKEADGRSESTIEPTKMNKKPIQKSLFPIGTGSSLLSIAALSIENSSLTNY